MIPHEQNTHWVPIFVWCDIKIDLHWRVFLRLIQIARKNQTRRDENARDVCKGEREEKVLINDAREFIPQGCESARCNQALYYITGWVTDYEGWVSIFIVVSIISPFSYNRSIGMWVFATLPTTNNWKHYETMLIVGKLIVEKLDGQSEIRRFEKS